MKYPEYLLLNAKNSLYLKDYDTARHYLFKAVNIGSQPEPVDILLSRIGDTYHNQEKEKDAEKYYRMVIDYYPESEGASIAKLRLADYFSDITILEDLSKNEREPIGDLAILEKGYQLFEQNQYTASMDSLRELMMKPVVTETRKDAKHLYYKAAEKALSDLFSSGMYEKMTELYRSEKTLLDNNIEPEALLLTGQAFLNLGLYGEAVSTFTLIRPYDLKINSKGKYFYGLASGYTGKGNIESAEKILETGIKEKLELSDTQKLTMLLGDLFKDNGKPDDAYRLYQQ